MLARGSRIHDYEVWGKLGEGGMSEVWLAKHVVLSVPVIIKTLRRSIFEAAGEAGAQRMFNEARLMARVTSPRVVRAIDAGTAEGTPYLVQEYVDGIDVAELDHWRRRALGVGLPLWVVCHLMDETCQALCAAHQVGVIHRDVKPSNLFCAPDTGIRLGDFGIAVARADTPPEEISGTIRFMAPEQLRGAVTDRATDVYGAGATAFDLRYGHAPFPELSRILDDSAAVEFPSAKSPGEAYFQHLLGEMLRKNRAERPEDLAEPGRHFATLAQALKPRSPREWLSCMTKHAFRLADCEVVLKVGDLSMEEADALVSSASYHLKMRTGVGEALRVRGGDVIEDEAVSGGERALGAVVATSAGTLKARKVLHAVSAWDGTSCVGRAMYRALLMADELGIHTLALPALGTGAARVTVETSANAMMTALRWHLALGGTRLRRVTVVLGDEAKLRTYRDVAEEALRGHEETVHAGDLGLPVEGEPVKEDAATYIDTRNVES
jgi:serine/threonine-protein kinase